MPNVSVIMGVFNCKRPDLLKKSIKSIINQSYLDWEFIICDDGSTDETTLRILKQFENEDSRIKIFSYRSNKGLCYALNFCMMKATGKYIVRQDDDDISHYNRIEKLVGFAENHPEYAIVGSLASVVDDNGIWGEYLLEEKPSRKSFYWSNPFAHPTVLMRKEALKSVGGYRVAKETRRCEDYDLFMRMYAVGYVGYNIQEKLYEYRVENGRKKYRSLKDRVEEVVVRYKGYKQLGILRGGLLFVLKPLVIWVIPQSIFRVIKNLQYHHKN